MAQNPIPPQPPALLTPTAFAQKYRQVFADNIDFRITEGDLRVEAADIADLFLFWAQLGRTLLLDTEAELATVDQRTLVLNQLAYVGRTGLAPGAGEVGEFILRPDSQGPLWAYRSYKSLTRVRARWLPIGDPTAHLAQFPVLQLDAHPYAAGDVVQHTFANAQTLLLEVRRALPLAGAGTANPGPTGLATDPNYRPFAPLVSPQHVQNTDQGTTKDYFQIGNNEENASLPGLQVIHDAAGNRYRGLTLYRRAGLSQGFIGAKVLQADGTPVWEPVTCASFEPDDLDNEFEPIGSGTSLPGLSNLHDFEDYEVPYDGEVTIDLPVGTLGVLPIVCLQPDPNDPTKGVSRPIFAYSYDRATRKLSIAGSAGLVQGSLLKFQYYTAGAATGAGGGNAVVDFFITEDAYPDRALNMDMEGGEQFGVLTRHLQTLETVAFQDYSFLPGGGIKPYTYKKGVVYRDLVARKAYECRQEHTVSSAIYPTEGPFFLEVPYLTKELGEYLSNGLAAVPGLIASAPGKMPRYYATHNNGTIFNGEYLNDVAASIGNYSGRVYVMGAGTLNGDATLRYGNTLYGSNYAVDLNGYVLTQGRESVIADLHIRNGKLSLYGTAGRSYNGGSLDGVAIVGPGGQTIDFHGTPITCAAGFKLVQDGVVVNWYGSAAYPKPALPAGADVSGGTVNIFNYVAPTQTPAPGSSSGLTNGETVFSGDSGTWAQGLGLSGMSMNAFLFLPMMNVAVNYNSGWDSASKRFTMPVSGSYLIVTKVMPGQSPDTTNSVGRDFYAGPSVGTAGDSPDGLWGVVGPSTRPGIKISTAKHYHAGDLVGLAHYQENCSFPYLCSMSIILLKAD